MSAALPAEVRELLGVVLAAIDIPCPATVGDAARHQEILAERAMHAAITLRGLLGEGTPSLADLAWQTAYLCEQLAQHPPTGYRTGPWPGFRSTPAGRTQGRWPDMRQPTSTAARELRRCHDAGRLVAVIYLGADGQAHYREGRVTAINGDRFVLEDLDPAGTARRASFDLANPEDVLAMEPLR